MNMKRRNKQVNHHKKICIRISESLNDLLNDICEKTKDTKSKVIRDIMIKEVNKRHKLITELYP